MRGRKQNREYMRRYRRGPYGNLEYMRNRLRDLNAQRLAVVVKLEEQRKESQVWDEWLDRTSRTGLDASSLR